MFKMYKDVELLMTDIIMTSDLNPLGQLNDMNKIPISVRVNYICALLSQRFNRRNQKVLPHIQI